MVGNAKRKIGLGWREHGIWQTRELTILETALESEYGAERVHDGRVVPVHRVTVNFIKARSHDIQCFLQRDVYGRRLIKLDQRHIIVGPR